VTFFNLFIVIHVLRLTKNWPPFGLAWIYPIRRMTLLVCLKQSLPGNIMLNNWFLLRPGTIANCPSSVTNSSEETCFACLRRRPRYCLPCQHWVCQNCVRVLCTLSDQDPWLFNVKKCLLCDATFNNVQIRVKPDTASPRILSIDGGGARGRAPLEFLRVLQHTIALPYPVQRNFDMVFGTSSGRFNHRCSPNSYANS
jgi:hypothetical protein